MEDRWKRSQTVIILLTAPILWVSAGLIYVFVILPIFLLRFVVLQTLSSTPPSFWPDRGFVFMGEEGRSKNSNVLLGYTLLDGQLSVDELRVKFVQNVLKSRNAETGRLNYPKYQQTIKTCLGFPFWKWDTRFRIDHHIRPLEGTENKSVTTEEELLDLLGPLANKGFERGRPPWEYLHVSNYVASYSPGGRPRTLVVYRIHHGLCDGYSIVKCFVQHTCGDTLDKIMRPPAQDKRKRRSWYKETLELGLLVAGMPACLLQQISNWDSNAWFLRRRELKRECHVGMTRRIPLRLLKQVSQEQGVSFSSVLFGLVGGGIHRFFQLKYAGTGVKVPEHLQCFTPFPRPNHPDSRLVNHWACAVVKLYPSIACPVARLRQNEANLVEMKKTTFHISSTVLLSFLAAFPQRLVALFGTNWFSSCVLSNFPGPKQHVAYFRTHRVDDICFWAPHLNGSSGIGISMLSYVDHIRFALNVDKAILGEKADVEALCSCIEQELRLLLTISSASVDLEQSSGGVKANEVEKGAYGSRESLRRRSVS